MSCLKLKRRIYGLIKKITVACSPILLAGCAADYKVSQKARPRICIYANQSFILSQPFNVYIDDTEIIVPRKFVTDLASIPRILWWKYAPYDQSVLGASILHDWFYNLHTQVKVTRKFADDVFYNHLIASGMRKSHAWGFWVAVRLFGWHAWQK